MGVCGARPPPWRWKDVTGSGRPWDGAREPELNDALVGHARNDKARAKAGVTGIQDEQSLSCRGSNSTAHRSA